MKSRVAERMTEMNEAKMWDEVIEEYNNQKSNTSETEFYVGKFFNFFHKSILPDFQCSYSGDNLLSKVFIYKKLLTKIKDADLNGYINIHKGSPFFFIGWYSFLLQNYDNAIFYLDAALSEDKKNMNKDTTIVDGEKIYGWKDSGAALFFLLKSEYEGVYKEFTTIKLKSLIQDVIKSFNSIASKNIDLNDLTHLSIFQLKKHLKIYF